MRTLARVAVLGFGILGCHGKPPEVPTKAAPAPEQPSDVSAKQPRHPERRTALPPKQQNERGPGEKPLESPR